MSPVQNYCLVQTAIGWLGIAWSELGVTQLQLPERDRATTERRLRKRLPDGVESVPTGPIEQVIDLLKRYASGAKVDFSQSPVDLAGCDAFRLAIYDAARKLGFGETTTYGELAVRAGYPGEARDTGQALGQNPVPIIVPCHRILAAGNKIGGFSAPGGSATKTRLLEMEGVHVGPPPPAQASFGF
ncbi:MAG: methylated-DNA--[protein]-cysteine S-methyltransferase [Mesorhizobium sp.]|jgi:methylated-DNA-[protein]-cysteine S-methyltransferase|nr:methylated-DNA--[protein]-cysteine S-methyltransferase [Mesorhizobium sp.]